MGLVDRDPLYTAHFRTLLQGACVRLLRLPSRSAKLNAYAERFVRSIRPGPQAWKRQRLIELGFGIPEATLRDARREAPRAATIGSASGPAPRAVKGYTAARLWRRAM